LPDDPGSFLDPGELETHLQDIPEDDDAELPLALDL